MDGLKDLERIEVNNGDKVVGKQINDLAKKRKEKIYGTIFLTSVAGASALFGFGFALALAKKRDPTLFVKGMVGAKEVPESGGSLALRALGRGTLYSVTGFTLFCYTVWRAMGVKDLQEFRLKVGSWLPRIPRHEPQGRSEFGTVRELVNYIIEQDKIKKENKAKEK